jgi:galactose mutarotase-like enzyme
VIDKNGFERIWQGDPAVWTGHAPVLFPFAGGLKDDYFMYGGRRYELPKHGFARSSEFTVEQADKTSVTFLLDEQNANYPFEYAFRVRFSLSGASLQVDYIVKNNGDVPMYYGVGAHEAYACPDGIEHYTLVFDREESLRASVLEGSQITERTNDLTENSKVLRLKADHFRPDALIFLHLNSSGVTLESDRRKDRVRVDFDGFDNLLIWQKPRAHYVCIEPWTNPPEYTTSDHMLSHKPGMLLLAPGREETHTHTITFL